MKAKCERMFSIFYAIPAFVEEAGRNEHGGGARVFSSTSWEHSRAAQRATEPRVLSRNLIGDEEKRKKREGKVESGEDVKSDEGKKWIVTKESARSGLMQETKKKETKLKQNKSTVVLCSLSLTSALRRGDYYIIPYICIIYITWPPYIFRPITRIGIFEAKRKIYIYIYI